MANLPHASRRAALLASAAGMVIAGTSWDAIAQNVTYTNSTAIPAQPTTVFPLLNGDTLINNATGSISILSTATGFQPVVSTTTLGVGLIQNAGTIASAQNPGGIAIGVNTLSSLSTINNQATGTIAANGTNGTAIQVLGSVTSLLNSGFVSATGAGGIGGSVGTAGTIGTLTNNAGGTIASTGSAGLAIANAGTISTLSNSGLIQASGMVALNVDGGGGIGLLTNTSTGTIAANSASASGIAIGTTGTGTVATLSNAGLIQATGTNGGGIYIAVNGSVGVLTNAASGTISGNFSGASLYGAVGTMTNSGLIQATGTAGAGIYIDTSGTRFGSIVNLSGGTIVATADHGTGIGNAGTIGTLSNSGLIQANGSYGTGIGIGGNGTIGLLTNTATGSIVANGTDGIGISVGEFSTGRAGTLSNSGLVQATGTYGLGILVGASGSVGTLINNAGGTIAADDAAIENFGTIGTVTNSGLVKGVTAGVMVRSRAGGTVTVLTNASGGSIVATGTAGSAIQIFGTIATLSNSGLIQANASKGFGIDVRGVRGGGTIGTLINASTGTIAANGYYGAGVAIGTRGTGRVGTLSNAGLIQATGSYGAGILIARGGNVAAITNAASGTIVGRYAGMSVYGSLGTSTNSGVIQGVTAGVSVTSTGTFSVLTNTATGLIQGGPADGSGTAIDNAASARAMTIANAGTIIGAIKQGTGADVLNVTGGSITGAIVGQTGSGGQVNFNLGSGGSFVTGGSITNVPTVNVNSGMLTVAALSGNAISGASLFRIASGATATLNGNVGATLTSNSGFVNVGTNAISVSGNFTQASTGQLGVSVAGSTFGSLNVGGTANIASTGTGIALHFLSSSTLTSLAVLTSGGIAVSPTQTVSSDSTDPWLQNAIASTVGNNLVVTFAAPSANQIDTAYNTIVAPTTVPLAGSALNNQNQAINGVRQLLDSLSGNRQAGQALLNVLSTLTPRQLSQFFQQVQPSMLGSAQSLIATALNNSGGLTASVGDRVTALRENGGMAAGDEPGRGFSVWATPTIKGFTQGQKEGISGFTATSYGAAFGADTLVRPDTRVGLSVGLTQTDVSFSGPLSGNRNTALTAQAGVYGTWFQNNFFIDGAAGFGYSWYNTKENISGFGATRNGDFGGVQFNAKIAAGYDWRVMGAIVTPSIAFQEVHLDIDPHATHGGGVFDLNVAGQHIDVAQMKLGSRFAYPIAQSSGWTFTPELHGYYVRNLVTTRIVTSASFLAGGSFTSTSPARDTDVANLGLGLTIAQKGPFALSAVYDYSFGQTTKDNTFYLRAKTEF